MFLYVICIGTCFNGVYATISRNNASIYDTLLSGHGYPSIRCYYARKRKFAIWVNAPERER